MTPDTTESEPETTDSETVDIPLSIIGDKEITPGDTVRLEVVSVDNEGGMFTAKYASPAPVKQSAIDAATSGMDEEME